MMNGVNVDRKPKVVFDGKSRTKQAFRDVVNINNIVARYKKTGMIDNLNRKQPFYGDVSGIVGYREALDKVIKADELFMKMSASIRDKFGNDAGAMIDFLKDKKNLEEAVALGMVVKRPVVAVEAPKEPK